MGHVHNIPTMQIFTGISRNTQSKFFMLSLSENSKIMHCGILVNTPYCLGAQPYVFEPHWLNSNICVTHFHVMTISPTPTLVANFKAA